MNNEMFLLGFFLFVGIYFKRYIKLIIGVLSSGRIIKIYGIKKVDWIIELSIVFYICKNL